jgi:hypothetical protein
MGCQNCAGIPFPDCNGDPLLICVRQEADAFPQQAWAVATCDGLGAITAINLFSDPEATVPLVGYTIADRIPCSQDFEQITSPLLNQLEIHQTAMEAALEEVETAIATASANQISTAESVGEEIETAIVASQTAIVNAISAADADPNYTYAYTYTANGDVQTITRTTAVPGFAPCEVQTYSYDGSFVLTGVSAWVACP